MPRIISDCSLTWLKNVPQSSSVYGCANISAITATAPPPTTPQIAVSSRPSNLPVASFPLRLNANIRCAMTKGATIGSWLAFVASPSPTSAPASSESRVLPSRATRTMKYSAAIASIACSVSTAKK